MRASPAALPEALQEVALQVLVREVPHAFGVLRRCGVEVERDACITLGQMESLNTECVPSLTAWVDTSL